MNPLVLLLRLVFLAPLLAATIWLEARLAPLFRLPFPRSLDELFADPARFFRLLRRSLPEGATLRALRPLAALSEGPDKRRTAGSLEVEYAVGDDVRSLPVFVKFQCARGLPLAMQAIRAAVEWDIAREIEFYRRLAPTVPLRSPKAYAAEKSHVFNRVCLVLQRVDGLTIPDWKGCPLLGVRAVLRAVAPMNAAFLSRTASDPRTAWIPARRGLEHMSFIDSHLGKETPAHREVWAALRRFFANHEVTYVHGDCRPGNVLFLDPALAELVRAKDDPASAWTTEPLPEVVFLDWEATNAAPLFWDFTYCVTLGLRTAERRAHRAQLLEAFRADLAAAGVPEATLDPARSETEVELLTLVLGFLSLVVVRHGFWDAQGNTAEDRAAWSGRVVAALQDVDRAKVAAVLGLPEASLQRVADAALAEQAARA